MKKIIAVFITALFLLSIVTAAFAESNGDILGNMEVIVDSDSDSSFVASDDFEGGPADNDVLRFIAENNYDDVEECVDDVMDNYPDTDEDKVEILCERMVKMMQTPIAVSAANQLKSFNIREIQSMTASQYRDIKQDFLQNAIDKCDETEDQDECERMLQKRVENIGTLNNATLERIQGFEQRKLEMVQKFRDMIKDKDFMKYSEKNAFKARIIAKTTLQQARKNYLTSKDNYIDARHRFNETKHNFSEIKERYKQCQNDADSEECEDIEEEMNQNAKDHLLRITDVILEHLNTVKSRVESNEYLDEEEASDILEKLNKQIEDMEDFKDKIQEADTKEDIVNAARELNQEWANMNRYIGLYSARLVHARVGNIIVKSEQLQIKLERIMERMAEKGYDTSEIEDLVDDFNESIELAKENYKSAMEKFREAKSMEDPDEELVEEAKKLMKDANEALKDAQETLRDIVLKIKEMGAESELEDESDEAVEQADNELVSQSGAEVVIA